VNERVRIQKGAVVDGFLVDELIHKGGMATLRRVSRPGISMPLLMKVPALLEGEDPAAIVGFEMEQMILPRLSGIHVPKFVASGDFAVQPYIVMEHIQGSTLLGKLESLPLPYAEVAEIGIKVAAALRDLHHQNVVHLDIKPSNIVIRETGEAALVDFGLAHHDQLPDFMDEEFRVPYGTAPYMAPEQILGTRTDPRSDLFALGVLLYFFSTGVRPFGDPKGMRRLKRRLWKDPVPPRRLRPDYPPWLQEVVLRCLEVDPLQRYPTAAHLAFDLAHPDQVKLTARSEKIQRDPWTTVLRRRFNPVLRPVPPHEAAAALSAAPIVMVAVDVTDGAPELLEAMRVTVRRLIEIVPGARFAVVNVLRHRRIGIDMTLDEEGRNKHVTRLVELKHWARPLPLAETRLTFHVLEATEPAEALLEYATTNHVDHVVIGARTDSVRRTILGSVSAEVAAKADCSVTVVRPPRRGDAARSPDAAENTGPTAVPV
jgi:nucleotide-binding universal stress UspA family protein